MLMVCPNDECPGADRADDGDIEARETWEASYRGPRNFGGWVPAECPECGEPGQDYESFHAIGGAQPAGITYGEIMEIGRATLPQLRVRAAAAGIPEERRRACVTADELRLLLIRVRVGMPISEAVAA